MRLASFSGIIEVSNVLQPLKFIVDSLIGVHKPEAAVAFSYMLIHKAAQLEGSGVKLADRNKIYNLINC